MSDPDTEKINVLGLSRWKLEEMLTILGEKPYRADQIMKWIHVRDHSDFESMTDISKSLRSKLEETAEIHEPEVVMAKVSDDGTRKWLVKPCPGALLKQFLSPRRREERCVYPLRRGVCWIAAFALLESRDLTAT